MHFKKSLLNIQESVKNVLNKRMFYLLKLYHFGQMGIEQKKRAATENLNFCEKPMAVKLFLFVNYSECKL